MLNKNEGKHAECFPSFFYRFRWLEASGRRSHRATAEAAARRVALLRSSFEDAEAVDEVHHEVAVQGVIL